MATLPDHLRPIPAGRQKLPREVMTEHQRARLLEAAISVFAEKGYSGTTVDDLIAAGRVGVGSLYAHFDGKEKCLLAAFDLIVAEAQEEVLKDASEAGSWAAGICSGLRNLLGWLALNPSRGRVALVEIQTGGPAAHSRYEQALGKAVEALRKGRGASQARELPDSLEETTVNGVAWLLHRHLAVGDAESLPGLFAELGDLILEPYLGREQAQAVIEECLDSSVS